MIAALLIVVAVMLAETPRSSTTVAHFRKIYPCPSTHEHTGRCNGYVVNHIVPLCFGGADEVSNLEWERLESALKRDVFEREACAMKRKCKP